MRRNLSSGIQISFVSALMTVAAACSQQGATSTPSNCAPDSLPDGAASSKGAAQVFSPDPMIASGNSSLSPTSVALDQYAVTAALPNLGGHGVLEGQYVDVRDQLSCQGWYSAYDLGNAFSYPHSDFRFGAAMAYYWGDRFRSTLDATGYLSYPHPVRIYAHCMKEDNAFFSKQLLQDNSVLEFVCLGDSTGTPGATYSDDASVPVHELEHATTGDNYNPLPQGSLNQLYYDEAGSLNEAVSDFMALVYTAPLLKSGTNTQLNDPKLFSRWALGTFMPHERSTRGAHKCPEYDTRYPTCDNFPNFKIPGGPNNAAGDQSVSYIYPDGMGWPYAKNDSTTGIRDAFTNFSAQEEIHNAAMVLEGTMWDSYDAILRSHGGDAVTAQRLIYKIVLEAVAHLPPSPSANIISPVTYPQMALQMVKAAANSKLDASLIPTTDAAAVQAAVQARGFSVQLKDGSYTLSAQITDTTWAQANGMYIMDNPTTLRVWAQGLGVDPRIITQTIEPTGADGKLEAGEVAVLWFNLLNASTTGKTAGGVQLQVTSGDSDVQIVGDSLNGTGSSTALDTRWLNAGYFQDPTNTSALPNAQVMYQKINGTAIAGSNGVTPGALVSSSVGSAIAIGNDYFHSDPQYHSSSRTGIWVKVNPKATAHKSVTFHVTATPANGVASTVDFVTTLN